jgi:hypothetical protein
MYMHADAKLVGKPQLPSRSRNSLTSQPVRPTTLEYSQLGWSEKQERERERERE